MDFSITNGQNIISIGSSDEGSYFRFHTPCSLVWYDNHGSVGKYVTQLPCDQSERDAIRQQINDSLYQNFNGRLNDLHAILSPLLQLLQNGKYQLGYEDGTAKRIGYRSSANGMEPFEYPWFVFFGNFTEQGKMDVVVKAYKDELMAEGREDSRYGLVDFSTGSLYEWGTDVYYATRPEAEIDPERVNYFETAIRNGERPLAILMAAKFPGADIHSEYFIFDGHHKLMAYQRLNINPPLAIIAREIKDRAELEFNLDQLAAVLYPWQTAHLVEHRNDEQAVMQLVADHGQLLRDYIRHGFYRGWYDNGQLKLEGVFHYGHPEGTIREWFENGVLKSEKNYHNRRLMGICREWYASGELKWEVGYNEKGRHGQDVQYFEDGIKKSEYFFENNNPAGRYGFSRWRHSRQMEYEFWYKKGVVTRKKTYNDSGGLIGEEELDPETGKLFAVRSIGSGYYRDRDSSHKPKIKPDPSEKNLGIIRERHYPKTNDTAVWRFMLLLMLILLLRMCK